MEIIILLICIALVMYQNQLHKKKNKSTNSPYNTHHLGEHKEEYWKNNYTFNYDYSYMPYAKGNLLTKTEHAFFITLVREALKRRLLVCPKVRLEDIIYVTDYKNRDKFRSYIKSRHVDFVLINTKYETVAAIELDDPSHYTEEAQKTDEFKNNLFYTVGIPLIRIPTGTDYIAEINDAFDHLNFPKAELKTQS